MRYAYVHDNRVMEIIGPTFYEIDAPTYDGEGDAPDGWPTFRKGDEIPIALRYTPEFVSSLVEIHDGVTVEEGYAYVDEVFAPYVEPAPDAATILMRNTLTRDSLTAIATTRIAPLQDAVDLDMAAPDDVAKLKAWKTYRVLVSRVDLTQWPAMWPTQPGA